ncbi:MAG TPA: AAA family ATPase [Longimicrobiaceae bacterium]
MAILLGILVSAAVLLAGLRIVAQSPPEAPYSAVASALTAGTVEEVVVGESGSRLRVTLSEPLVVGEREASVIDVLVPGRAVTLEDMERWAAAGAQVLVRGESVGSRVGRGVGLALIIGLGVFLLLRVQRGALASRRFRTAPEDRRLTLAQVGGAREARADLADVIAYLSDPARFQAMGARCPKGVLLVGPPGTGKTLLARAVAGESGRPVIIASGSEFTEMYVGVGARRVRDLIKQARAKAPCIVFIDEFDSLGGRRGRPNRSGEEENTLNQLLVEMDGLSGNEGIVWMAATNREDMLDPAVRRPGRFDRVVEVGLPVASDRLEILRIHAARRPMAKDVDLERLAALTVGYSGADLENLLNEAAIIAVQRGNTEITAEDVEQARDKIALGRIRAGVEVSDEERRLVALHEAGHVVTGVIACPQDRLHKVTIEARGRSLGAAHFAPDTDRHLYSRSYLEGILVKALGGRAAEKVFLGEDAVTSGAGADLVHATRVARQMVAEFGMSEEVGLLSASPAAFDGAPSGDLQARIDAAVRSLLSRQMDRAEAIVREHRQAVDALARALVRRLVLEAWEAYSILALHGVEIPGTVLKAASKEGRAAA